MTYFKKEKEIKKHADLLLSNISPDNSLDIVVFDNKNPFKSKYGATLYDVIQYMKEQGYVGMTYRDESVQDEYGNWISEGDRTTMRITEEGTEVKRKGGIFKIERRLKIEKNVKIVKDGMGITGSLVGIIGGILGITSFFVNSSIDREYKDVLQKTQSKIDSLEKKISNKSVTNIKHE